MSSLLATMFSSRRRSPPLRFRPATPTTATLVSARQLARLRRLVPTGVPSVAGVYRSRLRAQSVFDRGGVTVSSPCFPAWGPRGEVRLPSRDLPTFPASSSSRNGGWPLSSSRGRTHGPPMAPGMPSIQSPHRKPLPRCRPPRNGLGRGPTCSILTYQPRDAASCYLRISYHSPNSRDTVLFLFLDRHASYCYHTDSVLTPSWPLLLLFILTATWSILRTATASEMSWAAPLSHSHEHFY